MKCWYENCEICKEVGIWEYIWGIPFKEFLGTVRFSTIFFIIICLGIGYLTFGYIGILVGYAFAYLMGRAGDGAVADLWGEFYKEEYPPNTCSAKIENCKICDNEYSHEFNETYERENRWWKI